MNGIQVILILGVVLMALYYVLRVRNALMDLVILGISCCAAIFFILFPDKSSEIAHRLGVGRGTDLLFYLCILLFLFIILKLFARIRRLESKLTELVREEARKNKQTL